MAIKWKFPARTATVHCSDGCRAKRDENGGLLCAYGCVACGACVEACRFGAVQINDLGCAEVDEEKCIGCGACARKCPRGLIDLRRTEDRIAVLCSNRDKGFDPATKTGARTVCDVSCIGCGICAQTCPQKIIEIVPDIIRTEVLCSSYHNGPYTRKVCSSGCIGCHKCEKTCPQGAITVDNFLARIDWDKCTACGECAKVCPTGAMVSGDFSGASRVQPYKSRNA